MSFGNRPQNMQAGVATDALKAAAKYLQSGNVGDAIEVCRRAVVKFPRDARIFYALAIGLTQSGKPEEAIEAYQNALRLDPKLFEAHINLGTVLSSIGRLDEAIGEFSHAARLRPDVAEVHVNLSNALRESWRMKEAIAAAEKALTLKPSLAEASLSLGAALASEGEFERAISVYKDAIRIRPDLASAHLNLALAELVMGNLPDGWPEYEWRQQCSTVLAPRKFSQPAWRGEDVAGKTILLYAEQGLGDAIHFIRYALLIAEMGGRVVLECPPPLIRLFRDIPGIDRIIPVGEVLGDFDLYCALPSLPGAFKTTLETIPAVVPYLHAGAEDIESWRQQIDRSDNHLQIGLAWAGSADNRNDRNRSIAIEKFAPLFSLGKARFHSLQINPPPANAGFPLSDWSAHLKDFADTAALIANLDLIICVDTSVAHLAGAMGKKIWLLLPFPPDWRWMLNRTDSPWYLTMQLFRQEIPGDWDGVIRRVTDQLSR